MSEHIQPANEMTQAVSVPPKETTGKLIRPVVEHVEPLVMETKGPDINVSGVLHALRRNWLLGSILGVFAAIPVAAGMWLINQPKFEASALIRISPQHVPLLFETADHSGTGRMDFKSYKNTQRLLLSSPQLLTSALKKSGVESLTLVRNLDDPVAWLQKKMKVEFPDEAEIMEVSLTLTDGDTAQKIVDAVVDTYYEEIVIAEQNERLRRIDNLERVKAEAENKARSRRSELRGLVDTLGTSDASTLNLTQQAAVAQYSLLRTELTKIQFELMRVEGELQYQSNNPNRRPLRTRTAEPQTGLPLGTSQPRDGNLIALAETPADATKSDSAPSTSDDEQNSPSTDFKLSQLLEADPVGSRHASDVTRYASLIQQAEKRLSPKVAERYISQYRTQLDEAQRKVNERTLQLQDVLAETEGGRSGNASIDLPREIEILKTQERRLEEELRRQEAEGKQIGRSSIDVDMLLKEVDGLDKVVGGITEELERTKIELKSNSRIVVLGPARLPQTGDAKRRLPMTAAAGLFGLMAPLALLVGLDLRRQYVNGRQTMTDQMMMPVLGSLPLIPKRIMRRLGDGRKPKALVWRRRLDESVAAVTSLLLRKLEVEGHRVILISSATPGEGKSTLAAQLATSLADSGHSTLLIDFDLRRPTLHRKFNIPTAPGVTEVLRQGLELDRAVQSVDVPNLKVLAAGSDCGGTLLQDAANGSLRALFVTARANFEVVLVDSSPLLPVMDGRLVGQHADGAILSVIKDVSKVPQITTTRHILADYGIPVLGCVVTGDCEDNYYSTYVRGHRVLTVTE